MIEIRNLRRDKPTEPYDVRVDRRSVLGNPFLLSYEHEREIVCDKYINYFNARMNGASVEDIGFQKEMHRLYALYLIHGQLRLWCWCAPKRCHAETIKEWIIAETDKNRK